MHLPNTILCYKPRMQSLTRPSLHVLPPAVTPPLLLTLTHPVTHPHAQARAGGMLQKEAIPMPLVEGMEMAMDHAMPLPPQVL
jgi:hypothetical protein